MFVARAVLVNVRFAALVYMDMNRLETVIVIQEAVRGTGAVTEGKGRGGSQYAEQIKQGEHARPLPSRRFGQPNEHPPLPYHKYSGGAPAAKGSPLEDGHIV